MKKTKTKFEVLDIDELLMAVDERHNKIQKIIERISVLRSDYFHEWNAWEANKKPDLKKITKLISDVEPIYKEYKETYEEINEIKKQIIHITGLKDEELQSLRDFWFYYKKLDQARDFIGIM
jgi:uncharacterized coiled-coil DUF342 family protein